MLSPSEQEKKEGTRNTSPGNSFYERPKTVPLNEKQWLYIQTRYDMSPRELQVAKLVCQGFSNEDIAKDLKIKHGTVKTHLRNIYRRIRVKNKIALLLKFMGDVREFPAKPGISPPIPIVDMEKPAEKPSAAPERPEKRKK